MEIECAASSSSLSIIQHVPEVTSLRDVLFMAVRCTFYCNYNSILVHGHLNFRLKTRFNRTYDEIVYPASVSAVLILYARR